MTNSPDDQQAGHDAGIPDGGDLGVGGPAEQTGEGPTQPAGVPEEVDPARGPVGAGGLGGGDLEHPGAT
jgi:hypothetical protein